jgi:hypothetical protein
VPSRRIAGRIAADRDRLGVETQATSQTRAADDDHVVAELLLAAFGEGIFPAINGRPIAVVFRLRHNS